MTWKAYVGVRLSEGQIHRQRLSCSHCSALKHKVPLSDFTFKSFSNLLTGIALAFGHEVAPHPDLVSIISRWAKTEDLSAPHFKMARVSKEAQLKFGVDPQTGVKTNFPIVCVQNVYAFPGKSRENRCRCGLISWLSVGNFCNEFVHCCLLNILIVSCFDG